MISIRKIRLLEPWKTKSGLVISYSVITLDQVRLKLLDTAYFFCQIYVLGWKKSSGAFWLHGAWRKTCDSGVGHSTQRRNESRGDVYQLHVEIERH